jgi:hypothetical protein
MQPANEIYNSNLRLIVMDFFRFLKTPTVQEYDAYPYHTLAVAAVDGRALAY